MLRLTPVPRTKIDPVLILCAAVYSLCCLSLGINSQGYADIKLSGLFPCLVAMNLLWLFTLYRSGRGATTLSVRFVIVSALLFRVCLLPGFPVLENDIYRYLWDGYLLVHQHAVYGIAPADYYLDPVVPHIMRPVLDLVAYPDVPTVYGPLAELVFAASYLISPAAIWPLKLVIFAADICLLLLLSRLVKPGKLLLFAWCPLPLIQYDLNSHIDILAIAFTMAAVYFGSGKFHKLVAPVMLVLACGCKIFALLAVPFILNRRDQRLYFIVLLLAIYIPILLTGHSEFDGLLVMAREWVFNSFWDASISTIFSDTVARVSSAVLLLVGSILIYRYYGGKSDRVRNLFGCFLLYTLLMLTIPALNPWYLGWLLVFSLCTPYAWPWVFAMAIWLSLLTGINLQSDTLGLYEMPAPVLWLEYGMVAAAMLWDWYRRRRDHKNIHSDDSELRSSGS